MQAYEINYLNNDGSLAAKFSTQCASDKDAKILAHAMKMAAEFRIEVWADKRLIYTRPEQAN